MHTVIFFAVISIIFTVFVTVVEISSEVFVTVIKILSVQKILFDVFGTELLDVIAASASCLLLSATCTHTQW